MASAIELHAGSGTDGFCKTEWTNGGIEGLLIHELFVAILHYCHGIDLQNLTTVYSPSPTDLMQN